MNPEDQMAGEIRKPATKIKMKEIRCRKCGRKLHVSPFDDPNFMDTLCTDCSNEQAENDRFKM